VERNLRKFGERKRERGVREKREGREKSNSKPRERKSKRK
jgi:hypothetical protein